MYVLYCVGVGENMVFVGGNEKGTASLRKTAFLTEKNNAKKKKKNMRTKELFSVSVGSRLVAWC